MFALPPVTSDPFSLATSKFDSNIRVLENKISSQVELSPEEISFLNNALLKTKNPVQKKQYAQMVFDLSQYQHKSLGASGNNSWTGALEDADGEVVLLAARTAGMVSTKENIYVYYKPEVLAAIWQKPGIREYILPVIVGVSSAKNTSEISMPKSVLKDIGNNTKYYRDFVASLDSIRVKGINLSQALLSDLTNLINLHRGSTLASDKMGLRILAESKTTLDQGTIAHLDSLLANEMRDAGFQGSILTRDVLQVIYNHGGFPLHTCRITDLCIRNSQNKFAFEIYKQFGKSIDKMLANSDYSLDCAKFLKKHIIDRSRIKLSDNLRSICERAMSSTRIAETKSVLGLLLKKSNPVDVEKLAIQSLSTITSSSNAEDINISMTNMLSSVRKGHQLTQDECHSLEKSMSEIERDQIRMSTKQKFSLIFTIDIMQRKNPRELCPQTIEIFCDVASSKDAAFGVRREILRNINYMLSRGSKSVCLQIVADTFAQALNDSNPAINVLGRIGFGYFVKSNTVLDLSDLVTNFISHIIKDDISDDAFNMCVSSLGSLVDCGNEIQDFGLEELISYSARDPATEEEVEDTGNNIIRRVALASIVHKALEFESIRAIMAQRFSTEEIMPSSIEVPDYLRNQIPNLANFPSPICTIFLRTLNLYSPSDEIVSILPKGMIEKIIDKVAADEEQTSLKSEACIFLANAMSLGYIPDSTIGELLTEKFEYDSPGELVLLRSTIITSGFVPSDGMIYGLSDIVANAEDSTIVGCAIATLMTGLEAQDLYNVGVKEVGGEGSKIDYEQIAIDIESASELEDKALFPIIDEASEVLAEKYGVKISEIRGSARPGSEEDFADISEEVIKSAQAHFTVPASQVRSRAQVIAELQLQNLHHLQIGECVKSGAFDRRLDKVAEYREVFSDWDSAKIAVWAAEKGKEASEEEVIAIVDRANEIITDGHRLRDSQIISCLIILDAKDKGRLAQIKTGEGKTTIVATIAIAKALKGQKVDIITSSPVLAIRDSEAKAELYAMFNLRVSHNIDKGYKEGAKRVYDADIVYGDASTYQHDYLRHSYNLLNTRGDRKFENTFAIVDEVDSMMLDEKDKIAKIASHSPGMEYLVPLYSKIWLKAFELYSKADGKIEDRTALKAQIESHSKSLIESDITDGTIGIPKHLRGFAMMQASDWAESSIMALEFRENRDYVIIVGEDGQSKIAPVDHANTGTTRINTAWQNGLHQFLQMKHMLTVSSENFTSAFISNMGYFKLYGTNLSGLTGTLGSKESINLLEEVYRVDTVKVPTFAESRLNLREIMEDSPKDYLSQNTEDWAASIASNLNKEINENKRAALVLCETIEESMQVASILEAANIGKRITLYTRSDIDDAESITSNIDSGEIIVATNLAGRGTDIITSDDLESRGGLHVLLTFMPRNQRVEDQGVGRTARQGKSGTSIIIANKEIEKEKWQVSEISSIAALKDLRQAFEAANIDYVRQIKIPKLVAEDELFQEFTTFAHEMMRSQGDNADHLYSNLEVKWGMWLKSHLKPSAERFDAAKLKAEFEDFKSSTRAEYNKIEDPVSLAKIGYDQVSVGNYGASYKYYSEAIDKDPEHGFIAAYNMAYAVIRANNVYAHRYDGSAVKMAMNHLDRADENIDKVIVNMESMASEIMSANPDSADGNELIEQVEAKISILKIQKDYIARARSVLVQIESKSKVVIEGYTKLQDIVPDNPVYKGVVLEFNRAGLHIFYDLGARPIPQDPGVMIAGILAATIATPFTAGLSTSLFGASSIAGAGFGGMMGSVAGTFGSNLYAHKGRIDLAFRDSTKAKALRAAALDGLSGAMFTGIVKGAKIEGFKNLSRTQKVTRMAQHEAIKAGISSAIRGENIGEAFKRGAGNVLMRSASLGVTEKLAASGGFQRIAANTIVQGAVGEVIGRDVTSTIAGTLVSGTMAENNVSLTSSFELQDLSEAASALAVAAAGGDIEQIADAVNASSSVRFTRGLVKDDIREAIARGERDSTASGPPDHNKEALGVGAGDRASKTGSLEEEVREELASEELEKQVIHSKALARKVEERNLAAAREKELLSILEEKGYENVEEVITAHAIKSVVEQDSQSQHSAASEKTLSSAFPSKDVLEKFNLTREEYDKICNRELPSSVVAKIQEGREFGRDPMNYWPVKLLVYSPVGGGTIAGSRIASNYLIKRLAQYGLFGRMRGVGSVLLSMFKGVSNRITDPKLQPWTIRSGQGWKTKIYGRAQKTGTDGHNVRSMREAIEAAKRDDVLEVWMNRGVNKITNSKPKTHSPNYRPDVMIKTRDGKLHPREVPSKSDVEEVLNQRMDDALRRLPKELRGEPDLSHIIKGNK